MHEITRRILAGDVRGAARAITCIENDYPERNQILKELFPHTGRARLIGITGSPGAGKSSLVDCLIGYLRSLEMKIGVVAVDPTSPFTGGALLGDRVRMQNHALDKGVFIRSMGTRGSLGGLSANTRDAVRVLDAYGCDVVLIETVGVGQSELDVMSIADTTAVVLNPGGGDSVQAFKAGIMEIADLFVINKADLPGTEKLQIEVEQMLDLAKHDAPWRPPIVKTVSTSGQGMADLWQQIDRHQQFLHESGEADARRSRHLQEEVLDIVRDRLFQRLQAGIQSGRHAEALERVASRAEDPYSAAERIILQWWGQKS
ncbi:MULTISPECIES: methylmalonyl Co-A mutase-associated GTPase MeaB [Brevibacillus]|jgi:LAO/AO transport system kinase|uniref:methylmalonyl Co-A mutase-associated GTPase MeaB n=1 Tax=Brevibacillus TaxID=55080 RepID=UPI00039EB2CE|nr:methylmalonyl Co-A mutase-associated GTPase MeaB [Brevibacillus borstelensis]KKX54806.1 GTPase [Brevibacillus borstelensis cifa_chp40]MBE5396152.1 methylmalonyl Co-A mutase-associated GTPase MeaB [Brevibacillus borstelensis]MCC0563058.1 methylmalonyl Co-A mutase-associated GTPase MeaB [Brevibacillus borstelensis]MCM3469000.1 methylmalonyl Co-A mutase-associated GTPase MeaB [Brevibacillus borstelensis]MCM3558515.1 methylmalonyl Co-A mutase-associated GTPase MeaB [Brevibacillus borstelensis]